MHRTKLILIISALTGFQYVSPDSLAADPQAADGTCYSYIQVSLGSGEYTLTSPYNP